jgi:hypothetical protein
MGVCAGAEVRMHPNSQEDVLVDCELRVIAEVRMGRRRRSLRGVRVTILLEFDFDAIIFFTARVSFI